jgi:hypothetical protein
LGSLGLWRGLDIRADRVERTRLPDFQPHAPALFDPAMVADLPEPARRYFTFSIAAGTPLYTVADLAMTGQFSLGTKDLPNYMDMTATQTGSTARVCLAHVSRARADACIGVGQWDVDPFLAHGFGTPGPHGRHPRSHARGL